MAIRLIKKKVKGFKRVKFEIKSRLARGCRARLKFFLSFSHLWNLICAHQYSFLTLTDTHTHTHTYTLTHTHTHTYTQFSKITQTNRHTVLGLRNIRLNCH